MNEDKKVLITGASGGLGRACAVEAAKAGYYVICHYNGSKSKAEETLRLVEESGGKGELIQFNISDREDSYFSHKQTYRKSSLLPQPLPVA